MTSGQNLMRYTDIKANNMAKKTTSDFDFEKFKEYVNTYNPKTHGLNMDVTIIKDMVYGLGISLDEPTYQWANGFAKFKDYLRDKIIP